MPFLAKRTYVFALRVKNNDRVHYVLAETHVCQVDETIGIDSHAVSRLPLDAPRQLTPIVNALITMFAGTDDNILAAAFVGTTNEWAHARGESRSTSGPLQKQATIHGILLDSNLNLQAL